MFKLQQILVLFFLRFLLSLLLLVLFYFFVVAFSVALKRVATISLLLAATTVLFCYHLFLVLFYFLYGCSHFKFALCFLKALADAVTSELRFLIVALIGRLSLVVLSIMCSFIWYLNFNIFFLVLKGSILLMTST